jgi:hypothetical protein
MAKITDDEKKEIYKKWHELINMSQTSLDNWAKDDDRLLASLNRQEAKDNGKIQSGYDSFHRIKRRKQKPLKEWSDEDFTNAKQEIGFNSRMLGGKPGEPVGDSKMSKWEISLRNWGHDPSLKSSPQHKKWQSWNKKHFSKTASDLTETYFLNQKLKRASIAFEQFPEFQEHSRVYGNLLRSEGRIASSRLKDFTSHFASVGVMTPEMGEINKELGGLYFTQYIKDMISDISSTSSKALFEIRMILKERGLLGQVGKLIESNPKTLFEEALRKSFNSIKGESSILNRISALLNTNTPQELAKISGISIGVLAESFGYEGEERGFLLSKWDAINQKVVNLPDWKFLVVKVGLTILKVSVLAILMKTAPAVVGAGILKTIGVLATVCLILGISSTTFIMKKLMLFLPVFGAGVIEDLEKALGFAKKKTQELAESAKEFSSELANSVTKLFKKKACLEIDFILRTQPQISRVYYAQ